MKMLSQNETLKHQSVLQLSSAMNLLSFGQKNELEVVLIDA